MSTQPSYLGLGIPFTLRTKASTLEWEGEDVA